MNELANTLISGLNSIGPWFWQYASAMLIQSSILIALLFIIDYLILRKRTRAVFRYFLWMLILVKLVLPPSLTTPASVGYLFGDLWQVKSEVSGIRKIPTSYTQKQSYAVPTLIQKSIIPEKPEFQPSSPTKTVDSEPRLQPINWQGLAFLVWYAGVFVFAVLLLQRAWFVKGLLRQGKEARADLKEVLDDCCKKIRLNHRNIELKISANMVSPAVCGIFKHTILLPGFLVDKLSTKQLQNVIIHELAHIKRRDLPVNLIQTILQIVYFYNPLLWLANAIIRRVREQAVDEMVLVTLDKNAPDYSHTLIDIAEMAFHRPSLSLRLIGVVESKKALSGRIKHIVSRPLPKSAKLGIVGLLAILIAAVVLLPMAKAEKGKTGLRSSQETPAGETGQSSDEEMSNTVSVVVTDEIGRFRSHVYIFPSGTDDWGKIRTDTKGRFELENIKPEQKVWLAYSYQSKAMGIFTIPENYKGQTLHVVLNYQEAEISGRVLDGNGAGLANRQVELVFKTKEGLTFAIPVHRKTNQYGIYNFSTIPCGSGLRVHARVVDADENEQGYITEPVVLVDNQINVEMPLLIIGQGQYENSDDGRVLYSGRVSDEQGAPVEGVEVELSFDMPGWMSIWGRNTMTDERGCWSCYVPANHSNLSIRLQHPDYISFHFDQFSRKPVKAELLDGSNVMVMKKGLRIKGTVRNPDGESVENVLIAAGRFYSSRDGMIIEDCTTDRTKSDGSFSIGGLPQQVNFDVSAPGYAPVIIPVEVSKDTKPVEVTLKKGRTYRGQIVDQDGNPLEGIKVRCDEWDVEGKRRHFSVLTKTDDQGLFSVSDIPDIGTLTFGFGKSRTPLQGFSKQMPEGLSAIDRMTMYPVPVIAAKVIDAQTKEPVTNFTITQGCKWKSTDEEAYWSKHYKKQISSEDGSFEKKWAGFHITYPFDGAAFMKIEAQGYYSQSTPPVELGKQYKPFVIELNNRVGQSPTLPGEGKSKFIATLPNGVTVELVGLGTTPWKTEQQWWNPDGTNLDKPVLKFPHLFQWKDQPNGWQFTCTALCKYSDYTGKEISVPEVKFSNEGRLTRVWGTDFTTDGYEMTYIASNPSIGPVPDKTDMRLAVGSEEFVRARRLGKNYTPKQHQIHYLEKNSDQIILHPVRIGSVGTPCVDLTCKQENKEIEFRVFAKLKNGKTEQWCGGGIGKDVLFFQSTPKRQNTTIEDIEDIIIEFRPYQWVTFKNVSLKPNSKTDVQVDVENNLATENTENTENNRKTDVPVEGDKKGGLRTHPTSIDISGSKLEFRVAVKPKYAELSEKEISQLKTEFNTNGVRRVRRGENKFQWFEARSEKEFQRFIDSKYQRFIIGEYQGRKYVLLYDDKSYVMLSGQGWGLQKVEAVTDPMGNPAVAFEFDETGTVLFGTLTASNLQKSLAIVIDDKVYSAPTVETKIQGKGRISGRFSEEEVPNLVKALKIGMPPIRGKLHQKLLSSAKQAFLIGGVVNQNGGIITGAEVGIGLKQQPMMIGGSKEHSRNKCDYVSTDKAGIFRISKPETKDYMIVVSHSQGYARIMGSDFTEGSDIVIQPWGRIEGKFIDRVGTGSTNKIHIRRRPLPGWSCNYYDFQNSIYVSDSEGKFVFEQVMDGWVDIGNYFQFRGPSGTYTNRVGIKVLSNQTTNVILGGGGRPVIGKFKPPEDYPSKIDYRYGMRLINTARPDTEKPDGYNQFTEKEKREWDKKYYQTDEYKTIMAKYFQKQRYYAFNIEDDGSFRIESVMPGKYRFHGDIEETPSKYKKPGVISCIDSIEPFEVPSSDDGSYKPYDLGEITLRMKASLHIGDPVPDFALKDMEGKMFDLEDFRGKFTLLFFRHTYEHSDKTILQEVYKTFCKDEKLTMVELIVADKYESALSFAKENSSLWTQLYAGKFGESEVWLKYGPFPTSFYLIDPDGRLVDKYMGGSRLMEILPNHLHGQKNGKTSQELSSAKPRADVQVEDVGNKKGGLRSQPTSAVNVPDYSELKESIRTKYKERLALLEHSTGTAEMAFEKKRLWKWKPNNKQRGVKKAVWSTRWYAKGDKLRYDITTPAQTETRFDKKSLVKPGSIRAVAYPDKRVCYNVGSGEVVIDKHLRPAGNPYGLSRCFDIKRLYQTNAKFDLSDRLSNWGKTVQPEIEEDYIGQIRCVKIVFDWEKIESKGKNRKIRFEAWVAPELSYSLIKAQFLSNGGMMGSSELRLVEGYEATYEKLLTSQSLWKKCI